MYSGQDGNGSTGANFSGTGVSQGPIASNNNATASGPNMIPMQPIASGGGDIVLSSDGQKSGKGLKWAIGIIVGVLILAGVGVGVWWGISKSDFGVISDYALSFNDHANYLLFGEVNNEVVDIDYDNDKVYAFDCDQKTEDECKRFFKEAKELLDVFKTTNYENNFSEDDISNIDYYSETFSDYYKYIETGILDGEVLFEYYLDHGYDKSLKYIEDFYEEYLSNEESDMYDYGIYQINKSTVLLKIFDRAKNSGCLVGSEYDQACLEGLEPEGDISQELYDLDNYDYMLNFIYQKRSDLLSGVIYVSKLLSGVLE